MNIYFGIRPTGDNLHIGHVMTLLNMYDFIKDKDIDNIYILLAEIHSEISQISITNISTNSKKLATKILALYKTYLELNEFNADNLKKIKFIFQNEKDVYMLHLSLTYKYFPLLNSQRVLKNPIFKESENKSVAMLLYPILQTFDVLLYNYDQDKPLIVFVSKDQVANINIMKDINRTLLISNVEFEVYDNIIYDHTGKEKMSKSKNNFVNFDDFDNLVKYITKGKTGNNDCYLYNVLFSKLNKYFEETVDIECNDNCYLCKQYYIDKVQQIVSVYNYNILDTNISKINTVDFDILKNNYDNIINTINNVRCCL